MTYTRKFLTAARQYRAQGLQAQAVACMFLAGITTLSECTAELATLGVHNVDGFLNRVSNAVEWRAAQS